MIGVHRRAAAARPASSFRGGKGPPLVLLNAALVTRRLIADFAARPARPKTASDALDVLTDREREVVALVAGGGSNDEITAQLFLSPATVKTHVSRAMQKLYAHDRAQLVVLAYETGLVSPWRRQPRLNGVGVLDIRRGVS